MKQERDQNIQRTIIAFAGGIVCLIIIGCSSSIEANRVPPPPPAPSATEMMQKELADSKAEKLALEKQIAKLQQDNNAATARAAEVETQLAEMRTKISTIPPRPGIADKRTGYERALQLFRVRNYDEAAAILQSVIGDGAPDELLDNCHYWLGECAYAQKDFAGAIEHFQHVFTFSRSEKKDDAQIMIANSYFGMGNKTVARAEYEKFLDKFPASPYAKRAKERLAKL